MDRLGRRVCSSGNDHFVQIPVELWRGLVNVEEPAKAGMAIQPQNRKLVIADDEAEIVRFIFRRYAALGSVRLLKDELEARSIKSKSNCAKESRMFKVRRPIDVVVLNCCVIDECEFDALRH